MKQPSADNIKVFIRVRPFNQKEKSSQSAVIVNGNTIEMRDREADHRFSFDHIFQADSTQEQVYASVGHEVVEAAFEGFNGTVFAYGQTSSGKTHTCIGPDYNDKQKIGILPRMVKHIYQRIKTEPNHIEFRIKISMVQIYMQKIKDLLQPSKSDLKIRQKAGKGIYIQDVSQQYVASEQQTIGIIKKGIVNRSVGQTLMNDVSSRSHMAFIITLYQNNLKDASAKSGRIILIDLAGSEKISKTGAEGKLLDEAKQINKSLLALGNVINALTENKAAHIPYRDSKLTRLLQQSLGGNSKTNLIINVSPSELNDQQTLSSLRFGNRAKQIKNKPKVNREYTVAELLLLLQKAEKRIHELQTMISEMSFKKSKPSKRNSQVFVENLLDSDHPILETDNGEENQQKPVKLSPKKFRKQHFESQYNEQSEQQSKGTIPKIDTVSKISLAQLEQANKKLHQEKQVLAEQIQMLNIEKVELSRQCDIMQQKMQIAMKQKKSIQGKMGYLQKQNDKLLQKLVTQTCLLQENQLKVQEMTQKIKLYEEKILNIAALQQKQNPISKIFGTGPSSLLTETKKIAQLVRNNKGRENESQLMDIQEKIQEQIEANHNRDARIKQLQLQNKKLQEQLILFQHLDRAKQAFIQEKLRFTEERERMFKDLENRIEKVLQLQQRLDQQVEKRRYYQQLINCQQSEKNRKILLIQQRLNQISENYYVLKGQQSSWIKDSKRTETKLDAKNKKIMALQRQIMNYREEIESLKLKLEQMQQTQDKASLLDLELSPNQDEAPLYKSKIVKVVRSSTLKELETY